LSFKHCKNQTFSIFTSGYRLRPPV